MPEFLYPPIEIQRIGKTTLTSGTLDTYAKARYYSPTTLFSSSVFNTAATTVTSSSVDISAFNTKTVSVYIGGSAGTMIIRTSPDSVAGTKRTYYTDSAVAADTFTAKSFTEVFYGADIQVKVATNDGTVTSHLGLQA